MTGTDRKDEILSTLTAGIAQLTSSDRWTDWLTVQSRFHHYSFRNTLLILTQNPQATRVAGFRAWQSMGRQVRKGEKAIWILAPVTRKSDQDEVKWSAEASEGKKQMLVAFKPAGVFDIAQSDGEDLPEICCRLEGDDIHGAFHQLTEVATSLGYTVEVTELPGEANGNCAFDLKRIRVRVGNSPAQQVKTLAHELAHAVLHADHNNRALAELEAESVAFVICSTLGIQSDDYSFGYCVGWAGGGDEAIVAIKASGERIQKTADSILRSVEQLDDKAA